MSSSEGEYLNLSARPSDLMKKVSVWDRQGSLQTFRKNWQTSLFDVTSLWLVSVPLLDGSICPLLHCIDHYFMGFNKTLTFIFLDFPIYIRGCLIIALIAGIQDTFYN